MGGFVLLCTLWVLFDLLWGTGMEESIRKALKSRGEVGTFKFSHGGWNRHYSTVHTVRFLPCEGGYVVMFKKKFMSPIFFLPDYYDISVDDEVN